MKLKPTKFKAFNKEIFGFDIETYNQNKDFLMCSIVGHNYKKVFFNKQDFIKEIKTNKIFKNSIIFATNLSFDFFGTFFQNNEEANFKTLFRGSDLLLAKSFFTKEGGFCPHNLTKKKKTRPSLTFLDTMNYAKLSVKKMGQIINEPKLETPEFIGQYPKNKDEWDYMTKYNVQDSKTTFKFAKFLIKSFENLGATFGNTLASTSMNCFKNRFLDREYYINKEEDMLEQFEAYYGGRTEALKRGYFTDYNYYDFNSLYPSVMRDNDFPDPSSLRITYKNTKEYIVKYEGVSEITIEIPQDTKFPVLPYRNEIGRVVFPTGKIQGWYSHVEIRKAMEEGGILMKVHKTQYFKKTCKPFEGFVNTLYDLRQKYKSEGSPMEFVTKIMLNSLYGKFGQRWLGLDNWVHEGTVKIEDIEKAKCIERKGKYIRFSKIDGHPKNFSIPIWAVYVAAYGRIKLHSAIKQTDPIYCDTDSIITKKELPTSMKLGDLKLEMEISEGVVVRPKFYALREKGTDEFSDGYVKIKGLGRRLKYLEFWGFLVKPKISYDKFTKFKEAIRRDLVPNEIIQVTKELSLEDEKRFWKDNFSRYELQESEPLYVNTDTPSQKTILKQKKAEQFFDKNKYQDLINNDNFDKKSVGWDISNEDHIENEKFFALHD